MPLTTSPAAPGLISGASGAGTKIVVLVACGEGAFCDVATVVCGVSRIIGDATGVTALVDGAIVATADWPVGRVVVDDDAAVALLGVVVVDATPGTVVLATGVGLTTGIVVVVETGTVVVTLGATPISKITVFVPSAQPVVAAAVARTVQ